MIFIIAFYFEQAYHKGILSIFFMQKVKFSTKY